MCSNAKITYKNRQKMISKTCTERTSENSLYHKRNEKIYKNRISFYQSYGNSPKSCRNLKKVYSRTKQESRVSVRRISFVDFNLPYYHFSLPSSSTAATATAKSLQSYPTLCNPIDGSPPGSPIPGILQARTLEWVAISFSNA